MSLHIHKWRDVKRTFTPPRPGRSKAKGEENIVLMALYGFTTIEQKCERCPKVRHWIIGPGDLT